MSERLDNVRKIAMYARGKLFCEAGAWERAYHEFYRLYSQDPSYEDVAALCAETAFNNATRTDISASCEHQIEWLEKVIAIAPRHEGGRAQQQLDIARYELAKELLNKNKALAAIEQIDKLSSRYWQRKEVQSTLAVASLTQGDYELKRLHLQSAVSWWKQALVIPQSQDNAPRGSVQRRKTTVWIWEHAILLLAGIALAILVLCIAISQLLPGLIRSLARTPTPTMPTLTLTATRTVTSVPSETQTPINSTYTATPSSTFTSSATPTYSPIPTFTVTPRPTPTRTPIYVQTATTTPTPRGVPPPHSTQTVTPTMSLPDGSPHEPPCRNPPDC